MGKVANCQVAVTAARWDGVRAWMLGAALYVPQEWLTPEARQRAQIPPALRFQEKWRLALTLVRQVRAAGFQVTAVLGDAEFGDSATLRRTLHRLRVAVRARHLLDPDRVSGDPRRRRRAAHFAAMRVTPAHEWRGHRLAPEVWLLFERDLGTTPRVKAYLVALPATASLRDLVRLAHHRWAIEQQYLDLKDELGLDHFEGRSFVGWHRHVVLTAMAYTWLQDARRRPAARLPSLPVARAVQSADLTK